MRCCVGVLFDEMNLVVQSGQCVEQAGPVFWRQRAHVDLSQKRRKCVGETADLMQLHELHGGEGLVCHRGQLGERIDARFKGNGVNLDF